jgi:hypothetical protein
MRWSRAIVGLRSPSTSGRATLAPTGVTRCSQYDDSRAEHRHLDDQRPFPAQPRDPLDHLSERDDVRAADVEALAQRLGPARDSREVADHVGEGDRLGGGRHPSRCDHHRERVDESDDRLERGTAAADYDGGPQRR